MLIKFLKKFSQLSQYHYCRTEPLTHGLLGGTTHFQKIKDLEALCGSGLGFLREFC